ncbi:hypothetical protein Bca4012_095037 [Brassica carinata]|uniref:Uncharacterized protein n=1 Tax=Brassica oleracea var. oleracea TaxID=109376 RepID=A0A0D3DS60_BRAOL
MIDSCSLHLHLYEMYLSTSLLFFSYIIPFSKTLLRNANLINLAAASPPKPTPLHLHRSHTRNTGNVQINREGTGGSVLR